MGDSDNVYAFSGIIASMFDSTLTVDDALYDLVHRSKVKVDGVAINIAPAGENAISTFLPR
ncbi:MAG: hypothetical protein E7247_24170 [Paenibacillaceae bacterium]|jgi:hypothetical protein|nr:hypothetical protein [Paenibacillaceae bacterium]